MRNRILSISAIATALLLFITLSSIAVFGSLSKGIQYLSGQRLFLHPAVIEVQLDDSMTESESPILRLENLTGQRIQIIGAQVECSCVRFGEIPKFCDAADSVEIPIVLNHKLAPRDGQQQSTFVLYTDAPSDSILTGVVKWSFL